MSQDLDILIGHQDARRVKTSEVIAGTVKRYEGQIVYFTVPDCDEEQHAAAGRETYAPGAKISVARAIGGTGAQAGSLWAVVSPVARGDGVGAVFPETSRTSEDLGEPIAISATPKKLTPGSTTGPHVVVIKNASLVPADVLTFVRPDGVGGFIDDDRFTVDAFEFVEPPGTPQGFRWQALTVTTDAGAPEGYRPSMRAERGEPEAIS